MEALQNTTPLARPSSGGPGDAPAAAVASPAAAPPRASGHTGRLVHSVQGEHHDVFVYDEGDSRYLSFSSHEQRVQTRIERVNGGTRLDPWMGSLAGIVAAHPCVQRALVLGVGGGALPMALRRIVPAAHIDAVDHDAAVLQVAQSFFGLKADDRLQLHAADARFFVRCSSDAGRRYDAIVLDVFDDDYIPAPLMTMEFLREMQGILAPQAVVAVNTFGPEPLMRREYATYAAVYGDLRVVTVDWNRLLVVGAGAADVARNLACGEVHGAQVLAGLGVDPSRLARRMERVPAHPAGAAPLCDAEVGSPALQAWRKRAVARPPSAGWSTMAAAFVGARMGSPARGTGGEPD